VQTSEITTTTRPRGKPRGKAALQAAAATLIRVEPISVSRETAATLLDIGPTLFDRLVKEGRLPAGRAAGGRTVWLLAELRTAAEALPVSEHLPPPSRAAA
jgi:hypothetical protein